MTTINNLSKENLQQIASNLSGKLWQKGDKNRIYVSGGNNYQYDGSWYYEIDESGTWESKCYLTKGYNNKNREEYVDKYLREMDADMKNALSGSAQTDEVEKQPEAEFIGEEANFGDNKYDYPGNFYNGCGSYYLAFKEGKIVASVNFTHNMECSNNKQKNYFEKQLAEKGITDARIIPADGSGTTFFARSEGDATGLKYKKYSVPKAGGGRHVNIELELS